MPADLTHFPLLSKINTPADLRALPREEWPLVCDELRRFLVETIASCGGHFAAGLGTVELTVALHAVFDTPHDRLIWDVGHQAYPHKVLTGRRDQLHTIRQHGGLHPFPTPQESVYDTLAVGHSSTSISAALGMALAAKQKNEAREVVAIIGDGAMTAGMAFEALNHAGDVKADVLVILNDNDHSISENVGALNNYFARLLSSRFYSSVKEAGKKVLSAVPPVKEFVHKAEEHAKGMMLPGTLFEELGFNYIGPIDGHNLPVLLDTLENMKALPGPRLLHVVTKKGKGFAPAENDPIAYHGVPVFDPKLDSLPASKPKLTYSNVFGQFLCDIAAHDKRVVGITPAMREGSDLIAFSKQFPDRYFDVAIAEQHAVTLAAGFALEGLKPVVAIYSTFLQRAYDQLIHDICLTHLDVLFAIDRGGLVGGDGATHNGQFDLSFLRCVPNLIIMTPSDENECRQLLYTGYLHQGPAAVRYPRGTGMGVTPEKTFTALPIGKARRLRDGEKIAIVNFGALLSDCLKAAELINATVIDMRFVKPLDSDMLLDLSRSHERLITVEENALMGGAGSAVSEFFAAHPHSISIKHIALDDHFIEHGDPVKLRAEHGVSVQAIINAARMI